MVSYQNVMELKKEVLFLREQVNRAHKDRDEGNKVHHEIEKMHLEYIRHLEEVIRENKMSERIGFDEQFKDFINSILDERERKRNNELEHEKH